jgi:hypothetical protein
MNGCECNLYHQCDVYQMILNFVSNNAVAWAFIRLSYAYKYALFLV